ncbi:helix-turn-helix domain-containing protein [Streptomyces sp. NPDC093085]|uniref:helix-turn-helix domain-containing protein n=1 Tax=Streptomyces sp. NPDC093085 TaxID=3155068 RepID=UPI003425FD93
MDRQYIGISDAAQYLDMTERWMYRESLRHGLPRYYFGGKVKFKVQDLDRWAQQQKVS